VAKLLKGKKVTADPDNPEGRPPLWIFTSATTKAIADRTGITDILETSGALLLENTCPEVVPYDPMWVKHILTNSMKAEHYLKSGLNNVPTSVMRLADCIAVATGEVVVDAHAGNESETPIQISVPDETKSETIDARQFTAGSPQKPNKGFQASGRGLPSQEGFSIRGEAFVTDSPITLLGFVNRKSGVIEEPGHPAHGRSLAGKIAIFPKGSGSTVAPYVLLELYYRGRAPLAIVNTEIDQQCAPACSLEGIPYAYGFEVDLFENIRDGDLVELKREGNITSIKVLEN
jgi:predicted aconitase with swiveling domain